jgi:hypothetical protein
MEEMRNKYRILVGKLKRRRPVDRIRCRWENNIKQNIKGMGGRMWTEFVWLMIMISDRFLWTQQ